MLHSQRYFPSPRSIHLSIRLHCQQKVESKRNKEENGNEKKTYEFSTDKLAEQGSAILHLLAGAKKQSEMQAPKQRERVSRLTNAALVSGGRGPTDTIACAHVDP